VEIKKKFLSNRGFTFVELLIAVVLIAVGLLAFGIFTGNLVVQNTKGERRTQAATYAQEKLEDFKNQAMNGTIAVGSGNDAAALDGIYTRSWVISASAIPNAIDVVVTISWANNTAAGNESAVYRTIISQ
jgi:prepilin-type N-terminal cleavage/methylation domain-containing protein